MKKAKPALCLLLAVILAAGMLFGCSGSISSTGTSTAAADAGSTGGSSTSATHNDTLRVAFTSEPSSLSTYEHDSFIAAGVNYCVYNGLYKIDNATLEAMPDLAESYVIENDVDWIFTLKQGVKFHDGSDFTADDVKATLDFIKSLPGSVIYTKNMKEITVIDDYTVKITTMAPYANLLYDLGYHYNFMLPSELIEAGHDFNLEPIGTGPYMLKDWVFGNTITFERFEDYFDEANKAKIGTLEFVIIPEAASRSAALEAGEVDMVYEVAGVDVPRLQENPDITVLEVPSIENLIVFLNTDLAPLDDVNFRRAIDHAINRQEVIDAAVNGYGTPNFASVYQGMPGSTDKDAATYDLDKAREYLAAWGGDPSSVTLELDVTDEKRVTIATVIQSNLADIGVNVVVNTIDTATHFARWDSGEYNMLIGSWSPASTLVYATRMHSDRRKQNPGAINSPEIDALVTKALQTMDEDARLEIIEELFAYANSISPQISLYQSTFFRCYNADLTDVVSGKSGYMDYWNIRWK